MQSSTESSIERTVAVQAKETGGVAEYDLDLEHTNIGFRVRHMMVSWTEGRFRRAQGRVVWSDRDDRLSSVEVSIDAASIDTGVTRRDDHLRSEDFLFVERFPLIAFNSTRVVHRGGAQFDVSGRLSIRGVTRDVTLVVSASPADVRDPWGGTRRGATATATINRRDFGLHWNAAMELGGFAVGDEVQLTLEIELLRRA